MKRKKKAAFWAAAFAAGSCLAGPTATITEVSQANGREVEVAYTLSGGPAVVLFDVQTNGPAGWVSIGGRNISGGGYGPEGACGKIVDGAGAHTISWRPDQAWKGGVKIDGSAARVVLEAYALDDTPDYMLVQLLTNGTEAVTWYRDAESLPGGLLESPDYRISKLVLRRIRAKNVTWQMGASRTLYSGDTSLAGYEAHAVTLTNDYYMGVFEITQGQFRHVWPGGPVSQDYTTSRLMRAQDNVSFRHIRESGDNNPNTAYMYPAAPSPDSFLGRLRALTVSAAFPEGVDFDLPAEAQWEYACLAGGDTEHWRARVPITDISDVPGRYSGNRAGFLGPGAVGAYEPNAWGLYDMLGNVFELCLDWYAVDITQLNGAVNANGEYLVSSPGEMGTARIVRGGSWTSEIRYLYPSRRVSNSREPKTRINNTGFRVVCRAGLR